MLYATWLRWRNYLLDDAKKVFSLGFEKISLNTQAYQNPSLISDIASQYGSQAVIASIDVKRTFSAASMYIHLQVDLIPDLILSNGPCSLRNLELVKYCLLQSTVKALGLALISTWLNVFPKQYLFQLLRMAVAVPSLILMM